MLLGEGEVEVEGDVDVGAGVVGGERGKFIDAEEGPSGGIVHGAIAAGGFQANVGDGAVAIDAERDRGFGAASGADSGIDGGLNPVLADGADDGRDVPTVARGEVATSLALHGQAAGGGAWGVRVATGDAHLTASAVRGGVIGSRWLVFEDPGFASRRQRLLFFKFGDFGDFRFDLFLGLGFFLVEALGGVDCLGRSGNDGLRHGDAGVGDQADFRAGAAGTTTEAAPFIAGAIQVNADEQCESDADMEPRRIAEISAEGGVAGGGGGHREEVASGPSRRALGTCEWRAARAAGWAVKGLEFNVGSLREKKRPTRRPGGR